MLVRIPVRAEVRLDVIPLFVGIAVGRLEPVSVGWSVRVVVRRSRRRIRAIAPVRPPVRFLVFPREPILKVCHYGTLLSSRCELQMAILQKRRRRTLRPSARRPRPAISLVRPAVGAYSRGTRS